MSVEGRRSLLEVGKENKRGEVCGETGRWSSLSTQGSLADGDLDTEHMQSRFEGPAAK